MPTTADVESRLRRTATACEPLVDALFEADPTYGEPTDGIAVPGSVVSGSSSRRRLSFAWLAAAAAVVAVVVGTVVVATRAGDPANEIATATSGPAAPAAREGTRSTGGGAVVSGVRRIALPDGTKVDVTIPAMGEAWVLGDIDVTAELGPDAVPVAAALLRTTIPTWVAQSAQRDLVLTDVARTEAGRAALAIGTGQRHLLVERQGWTAVIPFAFEGEALLTDVDAEALASAVELVVTDAGPVELSGPGREVIAAGQRIDNNALGTLVVRVGDLGETCALAQARCFAGGTVAVEALHSKAALALPGVDVAVVAGPPGG